MSKLIRNDLPGIAEIARMARSGLIRFPVKASRSAVKRPPSKERAYHTAWVREWRHTRKLKNMHTVASTG